MTISVIVCAHNEEAYLAPCLHSLLAQTRVPDEILVNRPAAVTGVRVIHEPRKGLVIARERALQEARGDLLVYVDADCRAPLMWLDRIERRFMRKPALVALSSGYRVYDWDWSRSIARIESWPAVAHSTGRGRIGRREAAVRPPTPRPCGPALSDQL